MIDALREVTLRFILGGVKAQSSYNMRMLEQRIAVLEKQVKALINGVADLQCNVDEFVGVEGHE